MSALAVRLLGRFSVRRREQVLPGLEVRKVQELFAYLLLNQSRLHSREALSGLLWGDRPIAQSRKYLRQALWQLQSALDSTDEPADRRVLRVEPEWVGLNPSADLWLDVAVLEQQFTGVEKAPCRTLDPERVQALQEAIELCQGDLLEGWFQDWCLYERERVRIMYLSILNKLMGYCEARQEYEAGVEYGTRILRLDRAAEGAHRRLMRLFYLAGNRTAALRQYECCAAALHEELGAVPARRTAALYEQIRADQLDPAGPALSEAGRMVGAFAPALPEVLGRLEQLGMALADLQCQVQQQIQAVESVMGGGP